MQPPKINFIRTRRINSPAVSQKEKMRLKKENWACNLIRTNPNYSTIINSIREGISVADLAKWFVDRKMTNVNENTFKSALHIYRSKNPDIFRKGSSRESIDDLLDTESPNTDPLAEANKLLRLQKVRLKLDVDHELTMKKMLPSTVNEIKATTDLIELIAKIQADGFSKASIDESSNISSYGPEVRDSLRELAEDEEARMKMRYLTDAFARKHVTKTTPKPHQQVGTES